MRTLVKATILLLVVAGIAIAETPPQNPIQSAGQAGKKAASGAANTTKKVAEEGYQKTKEGAEKAYGAAKEAVTGSSAEQQPEQQGQSESEPTETRSQQATLPQTASELPLLAMLGACSVCFGAWKSRLLRR